MTFRTVSPKHRAELPPCPRCGAAAGQPCVSVMLSAVGPGIGRPILAIHSARDAAEQAQLAAQRQRQTGAAS